jgi:NAD-dependent deacetylase
MLDKPRRLSPPLEQAVDEVADLLAHSSSLLFVTGAGISAESGLPTYRGVGGLYNVNETADGLPIEELLSGNGLERHPALTWKYLGQVERACRGARCNRAHEIIAQIEASFARVWTLTQNVDGLHRQAGSRQVIDIHGDIHNLRCTTCGFAETLADYSRLAIPPSCPECRGPIRPDVVLFGEALPIDKVARLYRELDDGFDLTFSIGTTSVFDYIAEPVRRARQVGKPTVEINPGISEVSDLVTIRLPVGATQALEAIWSRYHDRHRKR